MTDRSPDLGPGFVFGVATSAYQIEGATDADGRGPGIWDRFAAAAGNIRNGDTADVACDHYRRYAEDTALLTELGVDAYRFSVSWPRLVPEGCGRVNDRGIDFYNRLIDSVLEAGAEPWLTVYHWDLPWALQERGGWTNREIAGWFADFAELLARHYGDRISHWIVLNEACMTSHRGHAFGTDAPGVKNRGAFFASLHHQNLAQGSAIAALRAAGRESTRVGTSVLLQPALPASDHPDDKAAADFLDATWNRAVLDPVMHGRYPETLTAEIDPWVQAGDMEIVRQPLDFLGVNYYVRSFVRADDAAELGLARTRSGESGPASPFGMELYPEGIAEVLADVRDNYGNPPVYVTECGYADTDDMPVADLLDDSGRCGYLGDLFMEVARARKAGADVRGLFVWSLLDNFEWEFGYWARFGLVHVDYETQRRSQKLSFDWYRKLIARHRKREFG